MAERIQNYNDSLGQLQTTTRVSKGAAIADNGATPVTRQAWVEVADSSQQENQSFSEEGNLMMHTAHAAAPRPSSLQLHSGRAEQYLSVEDLKHMRNRFEKYGDELTVSTFVQLMETLLTKKGITLQSEEVAAFYHRMDYDCSGTITWQNISSYMYLEIKQRNASSNRAKGIVFRVPAVVLNSSPHRESLCRIAHLSDGCLVTCSANGVVCIWTKEMEPKRVRKSTTGSTGKPKWVTDMAVCASQGKIILTTGDCEIQFYELVNFQPYCQLKRLETVPLNIEFWDNPKHERECLLLLGDQLGVLTVVMIADVQEAFKHWKLGEKLQGIPTYPFYKLASNTECTTRVFRWKLHTNWISEVHYFPTLRCFASCSCDEVSSLVIGTPAGSTPLDSLMRKHRGAVISISRSYIPAKRRLRGDQRVFKVHSGVFSVDYCRRNNVFVTGSPDRYLRIWNPYITSKPVAVISGHTTPIFCVRVESHKNKLYSIGNDNTIKVWDLVDHSCLSTLTPGQHRLFTPAQAFHLNPVTRQLVLSTEFEHVAVVQVEHEEQHRKGAVSSHKASITSVAYSKCFNKIISACEGAFVKVWDLESGVCVLEVLVGDGLSGITAVDVDHSGRRLVTATQNGVINLWNFSNGQCIKTLHKDNTAEITDVKFVTVKKNRYIATVGWDHKVTIFADDGTSSDDVSSQKPLETWSDSEENGHKGDIMSVAFGSPDLMATAGSNGEIIVWRLILCNVICKLKPPIKVSTDREVQKVLFLEQRMGVRSAATLVAGGPSGYIHFWNIYERSAPMSCFLASQHSAISTLAVDTANDILLSADLQGYVALWDIQHYCTASNTDKPPHRMLRWRAHTQKISSIVLVDRKAECVIVTGSIDGAIKLWTKGGHYIGTFGQGKPWTLGKSHTYQHSQLPIEESTRGEGTEEHAGRDGNSSGCGGLQTGEGVETDLQAITDVESIAEEELHENFLQKLAVPSDEESGETKVGMRLRHLRSKSALRSRPGVYATLSWQPIDSELDFRAPASILNLSH